MKERHRDKDRDRNTQREKDRKKEKELSLQIVSELNCDAPLTLRWGLYNLTLAFCFLIALRQAANGGRNLGSSQVCFFFFF